MRALCVAFPDRICKRREPKGRRGVMVGGRGVRLADESAVADAELFVAVELTDLLELVDEVVLLRVEVHVGELHELTDGVRARLERLEARDAGRERP